jgi:hypothetical protein
MKYQKYNEPTSEVRKFIFAPAKVLFTLMLLITGIPSSRCSAAVAIYSPRGAEVFGGLQTLIVPVKLVQIQWNFPLNRQTPDMVFKVYSSTTLSQPRKQWSLLTNVPAIYRSLYVPADKPQEFFFVTVSNFLGEVDLFEPLPKKVRMRWNYPPHLQTPDLVFKVYHCTNFAQSLQQWSLLTNVPGYLRSVDLSADKPQEFFALTASNYLGESAMASK